MGKLTKKEAEGKKKYHQKRAKFYGKKIDDLDNEKRIIGFKINARG